MKTTMTEKQLKQIIKEEIIAQEGLMDFLRDPTGRKARAKIADLEKQIAQASSEAEKLKAEKEKAALEKAAEEAEKKDKEREAYAQAVDVEDTARRQREKKYHADLKKFIPGDRDFINDFLDRRRYYFDMTQEFKDTYMKGFTLDGIPPEMTLDGRTLREYVFVRAPQNAEDSVSSRLENDVAKNRGMIEGTGDKRFPGLMGKPAYYNYDNGNILIVDPQSNVYLSYADYRDKRYKGDLNQNALYRTIVRDLEDRGYVQSNAFPVPMSPENMRDRYGVKE
jgi:hypothetical protein